MIRLHLISPSTGETLGYSHVLASCIRLGYLSRLAAEYDCDIEIAGYEPA